MSWLPGASYFWIVSDSESSLALSGLFYVVHLFRMTVFFLLAGFFARLLCERRGWGGFTRDRLRRIVLPLVVAWPLVMTGIVAALVWAATIRNGGSMPTESPPGPTFAPNDFPLAHLWFLYLLAIFYTVALPLRALMTRLDRGERLRVRSIAPCAAPRARGRAAAAAARWSLVLALAPGVVRLVRRSTPDPVADPKSLRQSRVWSRLRGRWGLLVSATCWRGSKPSVGSISRWHSPESRSPCGRSAWRRRWCPQRAGRDLRLWLTYAVAAGARPGVGRFAMHHCTVAQPRLRYLADASYGSI